MNSDDIQAYFRSLGPWWGASAAAAHLNVSAEKLRDMIERHQVLAVEFNDGCPYFPVWQFDDEGVVGGLAQVDAVLRPAFVAPETVAAWLLSEVFHGEPGRQIDALRSGRLEDVLRDARRDAERILRP